MLRVKKKTPPGLFFSTKLRASLQQWQSLNCARIVIVRQRDQKERSGTERPKANNPPQHKQQPQPVPDQSGVRRWNKLRLSRLFFFCWRLLGLIPGGTPFSQLSSGVKDAMVVCTKLKNVILDKNMQKRPLEATHKRKRWNRKPSTRARTAEEGSGDVRKTTPMPEKKH